MHMRRRVHAVRDWIITINSSEIPDLAHLASMAVRAIEMDLITGPPEALIGFLEEVGPRGPSHVFAVTYCVRQAKQLLKDSKAGRAVAASNALSTLEGISIILTLCRDLAETSELGLPALLAASKRMQEILPPFLESPLGLQVGILQRETAPHTPHFSNCTPFSSCAPTISSSPSASRLLPHQSAGTDMAAYYLT